LSLAILLDAIPRLKPDLTKKEVDALALAHYMTFKFQCISDIRRDRFAITLEAIEEWLAQQKAPRQLQEDGENGTGA